MWNEVEIILGKTNRYKVIKRRVLFKNIVNNNNNLIVLMAIYLKKKCIIYAGYSLMSFAGQ